jgi:hypothetical protein
MTKDARWFVRAQITQWVDHEPQPGIVQCVLLDATGRKWTFVGKYYDFTNAELSSDCLYPQEGYLACEVISRDRDETGRETADIDTDKPRRGRESEEGVARFRVFSDQLVANALSEWTVVPLTSVVGLH